MEYLSETQTQVLREQFPSIADLRNQVHITYWSEQHLVTQEPLDLLPFGRVLSATAFYHYTDFQLDDLVAKAQRNSVLWVLTGVHQYNGTLVDQLSLFHNDTFLWHYSVPPRRQEIISHIQQGNRIRFLSCFYLSQTKIELEFSKICLVNYSGEPELVYSDSKDYTYHWLTNLWDIGIVNLEYQSINPQQFTHPIQHPNTQGRETEYQAFSLSYLNTSDLILDTNYWASVDTTRVPSLTSRASTPESKYQRSRELDLRQHASPALDPCYCGIDVCHCDTPIPRTPPTPLYIALWKPKEHPRPIEGLHYKRRPG